VTGNTQAVLKIKLTGTLPAGTAITGTGFTLTLPANVTYSAGSVVLSGTFAGGPLGTPTYTAATATTPGTLLVPAANSVAAGVKEVGEIATITLQLSNSAAPKATDFSLKDVSVLDTLYNTIAGMGAEVASVELK
jgi:hypothetical protein